MNTIKRIGAKALLLAISLALSPAVWALGLGDASVQSYLDQPLRVKIDLISSEADDLSSVSAKLASAGDYELIGASLESVPVPISFTVEDIEGDAYLMAFSELPISSPVLRLIVEVNWASGRMLREYTLFLDPPAVPAAAPAPRMETPQQTTPAQETRPPAAPTPEPAETQTARSTATQSGAAARVPDASEYGPVQSGETLWAIARDWSRGTGLNLNKVMIAIQRENPDAFLNGNINLLKRGAILRMPAATEVDSISRSEAFSEVESQTEAFTSRRAAPSVASPATPLLSEEAAPAPLPEPVAEESLAAADDEESAEAAEVAEVAEVAEAAVTDEPQLELVPPSEASDMDSAYGFEETDDSDETVAAVQTLREDLARAEEDLITQQQQNQYLEERIRELEEKVEAGEGSVEDPDVAAMEERLRQERLAEARARQSVPWYANITYWLIALLVLAAAVIGWLLTQRGAVAVTAEAEEEAISDIKGEAEDVLRVLADSPSEVTEETVVEDIAPDTESGDAAAAEETEESRTKTFGAVEDDAEVLDEESSDPEIQLDLARAYISMGDKEAARVILEEVRNNGDDQQRAEAEKMLGLL